MPARVPPEQVTRIKALAAEGKSSRAIAQETGVGKSSVARYMSLNTACETTIVSGDAQTISSVEVETPAMISDNAARSFLNDIGVEGPMKALRNEVVPVTNPLKHNPKALKLAQTLLRGQPDPSSTLARVFSSPIAPQQPQPLPQQLPPPPQQPPTPAPLDAAQMIARIQMNVENFAPLLTHILKPDAEEFMRVLYYKSDDELRILLKVIERARLVGNMANQFKHMFWMTTGALEAGAPIIGVKATGLSQALRVQDQEIQLILKEMALERADSFEHAQRPEVRLAFLVSTTLLSVDSLNRMRAASGAKQKAQHQDKKEDYKDL
jgi:hypothetical protein